MADWRIWYWLWTLPWCKAGCLLSSLLLFICIRSWAHRLQSRCWEFLGYLGKNMFWEVRSNRIGSSLSHYLLCIPWALPCLCPLLEHKDLGFHNVWFNLCPLTVYPYPAFQDWRFGFCSFNEMRVHLFWRIKCFGICNIPVLFLSLKLLPFVHIVFPMSQNTNAIKNSNLNASHGFSLSHPWDFHTFSGFYIYSPNLPWLLNWNRQEGKLPQDPQERQWQSLIL